MTTTRWLHRSLAFLGTLFVTAPFATASEVYRIDPVPPVMIAPFIGLLAAIALFPFINKKWWEENYPAVSLSLGLLVALYYIFILRNIPHLVSTLHEYVSFIALIGSLYIVSGGILVRIKGKSTPAENVMLLGAGAVIANLVGTTGASMLLIRPFIRINKYRIKPFHIIFFIFIISNIGGALTPIGDPPLFLGYLIGIPFFWIIGYTWYIWLFAVGLLLLIFYFVDQFHFAKLRHSVQEEAEHDDAGPRVEGLANIGFLLAIIAAVFISEPMLLREIVMAAAAAGSYYTTKKTIHEKNEFNFLPIKEVAILFAGIFATMIPALDWLTLNSRSLGIVSAGHFYWSTGVLSAFLDNAPTYLNFLTAAFGLYSLNVGNPQHVHQFITEHARFVQAVSIGAVFFGACSYIGNGPNFMVKSMAEQSGISMPSFFGYIFRYTVVYLLPVLFLTWFIFFR